MKLFSLLLVVVSISGVSCERHEFDGPNGTRKLQEHHHAAAADHEEGAGHGAEAEH